ncbi:MAG: helix-hairpin-helix domain-containing protein [Fibrobacterales bacterium]
MTSLEKKALILAALFFSIGIGTRVYRTWYAPNSGDVEVVKSSYVPTIVKAPKEGLAFRQSESIETNMPPQDNFREDSLSKIDENIKKPQKRADKLIQINSASALELTQLPGVGPKLAQHIVNFRVKNGDFKSMDELLEVKGIGNKKLQRLRNQITFTK